MTARRKVFDKPRWLVVTGAGPVERYAASEAGALIAQHVPYVLQTHVGGCDKRRLRGHNLLLAGTAASNPLIGSFVGEGKLRVPRPPQSYAIKVLPSPFNPRRQVLALAGRDERGVLYAARDFEHYGYDRWAMNLTGRSLPQPHVARPPARAVPFHRPVPDWVDRTGSPAVPHRGIWTWGHVIYDYRAFLEHMSRWKLNLLICWNDYAPVNAREVVDAAHALGIDVVWGYTWCWGEDVRPGDADERARWRRRVLRTYERQYEPVGGDGVYFQIFTETHKKRIGRTTIADLAVRWVNDIAGGLLERHPELTVQFGLHAISIGENLAPLRKLDPRVSILWEDAGGFPYSYGVDDVSSVARTAAYTRRLASLRGEGEDVGFVLKGMRSLSWPTFEHQLGPFVLGRADRDFIRRRAAMIARRWKHLELGWRANLSAVCRTVRAAVDAGPKRLTVAGLVEDAMWEAEMYLPPCLLAEVLWDPTEDPGAIVARVSAARDARCLA